MRTNDKSIERRRKAATPALAPEAPDDRWTTAAQVAVCGIFLIALVAALELARPVLLPATFAFVVGMMLGPVSARADRAGVPTVLTAIVLWVGVIAICYGVIMLLSQPVLDWIDKAPEIGRIVKERIHFLDGPLSMLSDVRNAILPDDKKSEGLGIDIVSFVSPVLAIATPALSQAFVLFGTLFFVLLGRAHLRRALVAKFNDREARLRTLKIWSDIEGQLTAYLSIVAVINLVVGIAATIICYAVGIPNALAWGVLAFILNFIPYIGPLIMEVILFGVGLITFPTLTQALLAPALYLAFTTLEGHFITPSIMGKRLTLSPLVVFLALVFWTWLWGPAGAFLAVPLLIVGLVAIHHIFPKQETVLPG